MKISPPEIEERLRNELRLHITVKEAKPGLLISGTVRSAEERELALEFVRSLAEEIPVAETIDIAPANAPEPPLDRQAPDEALEAEISEVLKLDSLTSGLPIEVKAHDGIVELTGVIEDQGDRDYVEGIVGAIPGVLGVDARLTIGGIVHGEDEHRPGEPQSTVSLPSSKTATATDDVPGPAAGAQTSEASADEAGGGKPYGATDVAYVIERAAPATWEDLLGWLTGRAADERLTASALREMAVDFAALQTAGAAAPLEPDALFDAAMEVRARGSEVRPRPAEGTPGPPPATSKDRSAAGARQ
ncbi:MAG: BON domain-containing protein [Tepidiformaceae bacterium]